MPRLARIVAQDVPNHLTQRGNNHPDVFFVDNDRRVNLALLKERAAARGEAAPAARTRVSGRPVRPP
jgi:hypothetical protein